MDQSFNIQKGVQQVQKNEVPTAKLLIGPIVPWGLLLPEAVDDFPSYLVTYNLSTTPLTS